MDKDSFYLIHTKASWCTGIEPTKNIDFFFCRDCKSIRHGVKSIDIQIDATVKDLEKPLAFSMCIFFVFNDFLQPIPRAIIERDMYLGKMYDENGDLIPDWSSYHCKNEVFLRSDKNASARQCEKCGKWLTDSMGKFYLYPSPPQEHDIFGCDLGLIVRPEVFRLLDIKRWKNRIYIERLHVVDHPTDGLVLPDYQ